MMNDWDRNVDKFFDLDVVYFTDFQVRHPRRVENAKI